MRPQPCRYCEQTISFNDFEKHVNFCGSKTKKCMECNRNVCLKDQDSHIYGGECAAYKEEDKKKKEDE